MDPRAEAQVALEAMDPPGISMLGLHRVQRLLCPLPCVSSPFPESE